MDQYEFIRISNRRYGKGIRKISEDTGHSRNTIRKALAGQEPKYRMRQARKAPVMDAYREIVDRWLREDEERPRKQRHTAKRIYDRLVAEHGFEGAETTVRRYVRKQKTAIGLGRIEAMAPLSPDRPGEAEVDWGEAVVKMDGVARKAHLFCMRPRQSGKPFVRAYPSQGQEMFFDGHVHAFAYFGGVSPVMIYDNLKTAVAKVLRGRKREEQQRFQAFRAYYAFEARFCNVGRGNEKGGVEGQVGYVRRNLLTPIPEVKDFEELNQRLLEGCQRLSQRVLGGREERIAIETRFEEERPHLLELPERPFSVEKLLTAKVDKYQTVRVNGAPYSVPTEHVGRRVSVALGAETVKISWARTPIAAHQRCFTAGRWVLDPLHYLDLLHRKIGAFDHARPIVTWRESWPASHDRLLAKMRQRHGEREGGREFVDVLKLYRRHAKEDVEAVIELALRQGLSDAQSIGSLFHAVRQPEQEIKSLPLDCLPQRCRSAHSPPDTAKYDRLAGGLR